MIVVRVELHSAVDGRVQELARMLIDNRATSPTGKFGDYRGRVLRGRDKKTLDAEQHNVLRGSEAQRTAFVNSHARLDEHVWNLVAKMLAKLGYKVV